MKKIFTLLTLLLGICSGVWATDYTTVYDIATTVYAGGATIQNSTSSMDATSATAGANAPSLTLDATVSGAKFGPNSSTWTQINANSVMVLPGVPNGATLTFTLYTGTEITINETVLTPSSNTYTTTQSGNLVMTCTTDGYIRDITIESEAPFTTTYTTEYDIATLLYNGGTPIIYQAGSGIGAVEATTAVAAANVQDIKVDATSGKLGGNNTSWAQINATTILTLPNVPAGATLSFNLYNTTPLTIGGNDYTNGMRYTTTTAGDVTMTCSTSGYIKSITVLGPAFCEKVKIASSGYSSFASTFPIDCANLPTGVTAYKAVSATSSAIRMVEVTEAVQAGTGLVLGGTGDETYYLPVVAAGNDISATNKLVGVTDVAGAAIGGDTNYHYILKGGLFYRATDGTLTKGKAYLALDSEPSGARELNMSFDDEDVTGIRSIDNGQLTIDNSVYDLQGRKVAQPTKGLYIVNGKKVIIK